MLQRSGRHPSRRGENAAPQDEVLPRQREGRVDLVVRSAATPRISNHEAHWRARFAEAPPPYPPPQAREREFTAVAGTSIPSIGMRPIQPNTSTPHLDSPRQCDSLLSNRLTKIGRSGRVT